MAKLYYKHEFVTKLKEYLADAVREELTAFSGDTSDNANIALRNRIAGMYDLISFVETAVKLEEDD